MNLEDTIHIAGELGQTGRWMQVCPQVPRQGNSESVSSDPWYWQKGFGEVVI